MSTGARLVSTAVVVYSRMNSVQSVVPNWLSSPTTRWALLVCSHTYARARSMPRVLTHQVR